MGRPAINEIGNIYGRLVVINKVRNKNPQARWLCQCECGNKVEVDGHHLRQKQTVSCGCYLRDVTSERSWKGGEVNSDGYRMRYIGLHKYKRIHRIVMEEYLQRKLDTDEIVHHIDGDKTNNRLSNLELTTQSKHVGWHNAKRNI